jgi:hypothetical protein
VFIKVPLNPQSFSICLTNDQRSLKNQIEKKSFFLQLIKAQKKLKAFHFFFSLFFNVWQMRTYVYANFRMIMFKKGGCSYWLYKNFYTGKMICYICGKSRSTTNLQQMRKIQKKIKFA